MQKLNLSCCWLLSAFNIMLVCCLQPSLEQTGPLTLTKSHKLRGGQAALSPLFLCCCEDVMVVLHSLAKSTQAALKMFIRYHKWIFMFTMVTRLWDESSIVSQNM